jgi:hypothetical protein
MSFSGKPITAHMTMSQLSKDEKLLLTACLLPKEQALPAWQAWINRNDIDVIPYGWARLLPLLWWNLQKFQVTHPEMARLRGLQRHHWAKNQTLFQNLPDIVEAFSAQGIESMLLKGVALATKYYPSIGLRPMADIDIYVPHSQALQAMGILQATGWKILDPAVQVITPEFILHKHALSFVNSLGKEIDLHWYIMPETMNATEDLLVWQAAEDRKIGETQVKIPTAHHLFLHTCVHGAKWNPIHPIRWVADAYMILQKCGDTFDWQALVSSAIQQKLAIPLRSALLILQEFQAHIPPTALQQLALQNLPLEQRLEYRLYQHPSGYIWLRPALLWLRYLRETQPTSMHAKLLGFAPYLRTHWGLQHYWQMPNFIMSEIQKRKRQIQARSRN